MPPSTADFPIEFVFPRLNQSGACPPCWKVVERYPWTAGLAFESYGARLGVRVTEDSLLAGVLTMLPPGWTPAALPTVTSLYSLAARDRKSRTHDQTRREYLLYGGSCRIVRTEDAGAVLERLGSDIHLQVAMQAQDRLFVHAGAVAWQGRAVVLPGRSHSGKTSLVAALLRAGAAYLSDEYAVFDTEGRVYPFAKPLSMRRANGQGHERCTAASLGAVTADGPLPVGLIVTTAYAAGAVWRPRAVTPAAALLSLLDNTVPIRERPAASLAALRQAALSAPALKSRRGEADRAAEWLLRHLA